MYELISVDYEILDFILKKSEATKEELLKKFPNEKFATEYRISMLKKQKSDLRGTVENSSFILEAHTDVRVDDCGCAQFEYLGKYYLTELGKKAVHDYNILKKEKDKNFYYRVLPIELMRSLLFPLVVAYITAWITTKYYR